MVFDRWTLFDFTSGANPYIATKQWRRKQLFRKCNRLGFGVRKVSDGHYIINDRKGRA